MIDVYDDLKVTNTRIKDLEDRVIELQDVLTQSRELFLDITHDNKMSNDAILDHVREINNVLEVEEDEEDPDIQDELDLYPEEDED